ncbi:hypothetical protein [Bacteroidetes bacterium endosymbiont of Geopemphigus sp.]|uniref:hypothetical protein n=1 Tax=Bacteroidetes bacterium endosymbiont of Geopemphigus sp. TaxID=2047937 RepID=UPI002AD25FA2|nr:hypothetical protein [Bacteroidetes bacterium endosymbiont of Geopemphigus sp.]
MMNAPIRKGEVLSNLHSIYVDQWNWKMIISSAKRDRMLYTLKVSSTRKGVVARANTLYRYSGARRHLSGSHSSKKREDRIARECGAVFIVKIGDELKSDRKHNRHAPRITTTGDLTAIPYYGISCLCAAG